MDWSPELFYYARRSGTMIPEAAPAGEMATLPTTHRFFFSRDPDHDELGRLATFRWATPVSAHVYQVGAERSVFKNRIAWTKDRQAIGRAVLNGRRMRGRATVVCDPVAGVDLADGAGDRWVLLEPGDATARVHIGGIPASLPGDGAVVVPAAVAGSVRMTCTGVNAVVIRSVLDVPTR